MVDWAAQAALRHHPLLPEWDKLRDKLNRGSGTRNEPAHFTVVQSSPPRGDGCSIHLEPSFADVKAFLQHGGERPTINNKQIMDKGASFSRLCVKLTNFRAEVNGRSPPPRASV